MGGRKMSRGRKGEEKGKKSWTIRILEYQNWSIRKTE